MAKSREHFALDWIKGELLETLNDARGALEAYVESDRDQTRMRACLTGLHQVHGTLVMLELEAMNLKGPMTLRTSGCKGSCHRHFRMHFHRRRSTHSTIIWQW